MLLLTSDRSPKKVIEQEKKEKKHKVFRKDGIRFLVLLSVTRYHMVDDNQDIFR